ncbi:MAG: hypothetical protein KDE68_10005 [Rhodocyclaceae bacterium]|nr:hypothetical protein [Rhodocyclaceae bacterium]
MLLAALPLAATGGCADKTSPDAAMTAMDHAPHGCCDTVPSDDGGCGAGLCASHCPITPLAADLSFLAPVVAPAPMGAILPAPASAPPRRIDRPPIAAV